MDNFDLRKYLTENRLLKEEIMVDTITMFGGMNYLNDLIASPEDYGFDEEFAEWIKNTIFTAPKTMSMDDHMDLQNAFVVKGGIEVGGGGDYDHIFNAIDLQVKQGKLTPEEGKQAKKIALNYSDKPGDGYKKYLAENRLLKEELKDVEDILVQAGFNFADGLLGGVGSGGAGYYDGVNDEMYGYNQSGPWNEEAFNKFYDNFSFASEEVYQEDLEDMGMNIDFDTIYKAAGPGIYSVGDMGYVKIPARVPNRDGGDMIEIFATPLLSDEGGTKNIPAFKMDGSGKAIPQFSKDEMRKMLKDDMYYII